MARLNLLFSGQYQILLNDRLVKLGYNKVRALLAYLLIECDQDHSRDELSGLLWPESPENTSRKNLRQALMNLRLALRENETQLACFLVRRETIQFNSAADIFSDILSIASLLKQSKEHRHEEIETCPTCYQRLVQAADLYKGDFLPGFSIPDSLPFEEWLMFTRERSRLQAIEILGILVSASEIKHDYQSAIKFSRRRLVLDPWNEDAYRALMRTLWRMGQRTAALAEYERCKRILGDDLAISPSKETSNLAGQIRHDTESQVQPENPASPTPKPIIPVPLSPIIGRETETQSLKALLQQNKIRQVTLMGSPGIGKTRLALHLADILADEFDHNVYFIPLISITNSDAVIDTIAHILGLSEGVQLSPLNYLERVINQQKILLILDNFEQVPSAATPLLKILQVCPQVKLLVISQTPTNVRGEQRFYLEPLQLPVSSDIQKTEEILSSPAVQLFFETVKRYVPAIRLNPQNVRNAAEICARLDGLPLAIELAAASVKVLSLRQLIEILREPSTSAFKNFKNQNQDMDLRHQTLWHAFQWSFDLLDPAARTLFSRSGIFHGSWSLEAAEAVCNIGDIQTGSMESMLALVENCLIQRIETQSGEYRFTMLSTIHDFAVEQLRLTDEFDYLHQRHADYFLTFARLAEPELSGRGQMEWLERIETDLDNFRTAIDWTLENAPNEALQLCVALFPFWHTRSYLQEGRIYLERACNKNPLPTPLHTRALAAAGLLAQRQGNYLHARNLIDESIAICRQIDDRPGLAYALNNLAIVMLSAGEQENAFKRANESLTLCRELNDDLGVARAQMILGQLAINQDDLPSAWEALNTSLKFWRKNGDFKNLVLCLINLGRVRIAQGKFSDAEILLNESLIFSRKIKDHHWETIAMWNLGNIRLSCGNQTDALSIFSEVYQATLKLGDRFFEALTLDRLGMIAVMNKDFRRGADYFEQSREIGELIGSDWIAANTLSDQGYAALVQEDSAGAYHMLMQSVRMFLKQNEQADLALNLERLALASLRLEHWNQAVWILSTVQIWRRISDEPTLPLLNEEINSGLTECKAHLGEDIFGRSWKKGLGLSLRQVVTELDQP